MEGKYIIKLLREYARSENDIPLCPDEAVNIIILLQLGEKYRECWLSIKNVCMLDKKIEKAIKEVVKDIEKGYKEAQDYFRKNPKERNNAKWSL